MNGLWVYLAVIFGLPFATYYFGKYKGRQSVQKLIKKNDYLDDWEPEELKKATAFIKIQYMDAKHEETERSVKVQGFNDSYFKGQCKMRKASRTFRFDRLISTVDLNTGEVIEDLHAYLIESSKK